MGRATEGSDPRVPSAGKPKVALHLRAGLRTGRCVLVRGADHHAINEEFTRFVEEGLFSDHGIQSAHTGNIMEKLVRLDTVIDIRMIGNGARFKVLARAMMHEQVDVFAFALDVAEATQDLLDYKDAQMAIDHHLLDIAVLQRIENDGYGLAPRMVECIHWTAVGKTSEEIAIILGLSAHTVNNYLAAATQKLNAVNRAQAVARALSLGIISLA